ncbi:glycosyltransferase family 4 protein [Pseudonocardia endophytica]|uniref:Glycosyltransferase involved in cell wall biosynthesis n=1 Tax=Pseudonocardia endophytica TaxID=401976 RepID=A0A4R1HIU1_PSEEN|nr:glycosyltransferase family 4 protein [Pseudonocardia endophytica]TCK20881.1 glycosyltransferase involved in cell wall biosynthesis [Pseudonocardia endophytica]
MTGPRIAYVLTQDRGGPVDVARALAAELHRTGGADVRVFGPRPARGIGPDVADVWTVSGVGTKGDVGGARALLDRVRAWGPDLVHAHDRRAGLVLASAALRSRRRRPVLVQTYHGVPEDVSERWFRGEPGVASPSRHTRATLVADAVLARVLDRTVVPAEPMRRFLHGRLRVPAARLHHVDNGLALGESQPPEGPVRHLLVVGLLLARKGISDLLEALARPGVFPPDARLTIAGDGPERAAIEARIARPDLAGRVAMLGFRPDVPELMRAADAVVVPSRMEQQPLVVIEAMAAGKPVLATDTGDAATMLDAPGASRHLAVPGDVGSLATALRGLFDDPDPALTGKRLAERAAERYSSAACAEGHLRLYAAMGVR